MAIPTLMSWFKQDVPRNTFVYTQFLIGIPFFVFNTYTVLQMQVTGFVIGTDSEGGPCLTYCIVPFGNGHLDLNSVLLYMNAMTFGLGGAIIIFITAYADFWRYKSLLVTFIIVLYGVFSVPVYWLRDFTQSNFHSMIALWVVFGILTFIVIALLNVYIPHCMRLSQENAEGASEQSNTSPEDITEISRDSKTQRYGFTMSIFAQLASSFSGIIMLVIVIILSVTLSGDSGQSAGLLVTTITGFITIAGSVVSFWGLPLLPTKSLPDGHTWRSVLLELLIPVKELLLRKNMLFLLVAYTIYTDTIFAMSSVTSQLFYAEVRPGTLEYSLYSLAGTLFNFGCTLVFFLVQRWTRWNMEKCLIFGYALVLIVPVWGCIGLASVDFGFKHRWEFYVQSFITFLSGALVNPTWRLLYSEMVPKGEEMMWFGLQVLLSCATTWVSYVATGPLQNATHELRFPLVLCLIFLIIPLVLECCRGTMVLFKKDIMRWQDHEKSISQSDPVMVEAPEKGFRTTASQFTKDESKLGNNQSAYPL